MMIQYQTSFDSSFQELFRRFTLDSASEFLLGSCVHSLSSPLTYPHNVPRAQFSDNREQVPGTDSTSFAAAFEKAQAIIVDRVRNPFWQLRELFKDRTEDTMKIVNAYLEPIIQGALARRKRTGIAENTSSEKSEEKGIDEADCLLDSLVSVTDGEKWSEFDGMISTSDLTYRFPDPVLLKDETLNILIAGRDTVTDQNVDFHAFQHLFIVYADSHYSHIRCLLAVHAPGCPHEIAGRNPEVYWYASTADLRRYQGDEVPSRSHQWYLLYLQTDRMRFTNISL